MKKNFYTRMMTALLVLVALVGSNTMYGQTLFDSYTDGDFTANPVWGGTTSTWSVVANSDAAAGATGSNTLRLNATAVSATEYLSSQITTWGVSQEWGFFLGRRAQALTAANQAYFWLYANEATLTSATVDGYRIAIGDDAGNDDIRLEYILNGAVNSTVIASAGAVTNGITDFGILIRVTRSATGVWEVFTSTIPVASGTGAIASSVPNSANASISQGTAANNTLVPATGGYLGLAALHSTGGNAIISTEFDQVYFTQSSGGTTATLAGITQPSGSITQGTTNAVLSGFSITPSASVDFSDVTITSTGTATSSDISSMRIFKDNDGNGAINGADAPVTGPAAQTYGATMNFTGITSETGLTAQSFYLVVADIGGVGISTPGRTTTTSSNSFVTTATTNSGSFVGNLRTIAAPPGTTTITAGAGIEPSTISSLVNTSGAASLNFDFTIIDDGATSATDAIATQISQVVLNAGTGNTITNWANAIAGVELSDGTNSTTTATIGASSITFAALPNTAGTIGYIADDASKTYTLKIWLKSAMGALATTIDGQNFVFRIQTADVTVAGSQVIAGQDVNSVSTNNVVDVTATALAFVQQPAASVAINSAMSPAITVSANDANGNRDLGFTASIDITSTGTLSGSPVSVSAVSGLASFPTLTHTANGNGLTLNAERSGTMDWDIVSSLFDVVTPSSATDFFRSKAAGPADWNTPASWESSADGITNWGPSTLVPGVNASGINIRPGHTITVSAATTIDQTSVEGTLVVQTGGTITMNDGTGDDLNIKTGGVLQVTATSTYAATIFVLAGADINVGSGGKVLIGSGAGVGGGYGTFGTAATGIVWNDGAILDWNSTTTFAASGVTFFPGVTSSTIPVLRISANPGTPGGAGTTVVNGKLDVIATFSFAGAGAKTFRNGITGTGTLSQGTFGQFIINGTTAELGGTGIVTLGANGLSIAAGTTTLSSDKTINSGTIAVTGSLVTGVFQLAGSAPVNVNNGGVLKIGSLSVAGAVVGNIPTATLTLTLGSTVEFNGTAAQFAAAGTFENLAVNNANGVSLLGNVNANATINLANGSVVLGNNNLSAAAVTGGDAGKFIVTDGTGSLTIKNITIPVVFPVGTSAGSFTPVTVNNSTGTADDFAVNVTAGTPCNVNPLSSINRVWTITEAVPGGSIADITLQWNPAEENASFVRSLCAAVHCAGGVVDLKGTNAAAAGTNPYTQTITGISSFSPFGVTSDVIILPVTVEYFHGNKQGNLHAFDWKVSCTNTASATLTLERSNDGGNYSGIYSLTATAIRCLQPFSFNDAAPIPGLNYYRLKMTDADGKVSYSSIVVLIGKGKVFDLLNISPNPVTSGKFRLNITASEPVKMTVNITDGIGRVLAKQDITVIDGDNSIEINVNKLPAGIYQLYGNAANGRTKVIQFVKQ